MAAVSINWKPDARLLRQFGFTALFGFGLLAVAAWTESLMFSTGLGDGRFWVTSVLASVGVLSGLLALVFPRANLPLYLLLSVVTYPIGFVLSYVVLGLLFFGVLAPIGLGMRIFGRDALQRQRRSQRDSYWQECGPARPMSSYFKQF